MNDLPKSLSLEWPLAPPYPAWVGLNEREFTPRAWVLYKLKAADWYTEALEAVGGLVGFDRYVGVEMALDGAFASLVGAFDAAVAAVIQCAEEYAQVEFSMGMRQGPPKRTPSWGLKWPVASHWLTEFDTRIATFSVSQLVQDIDAGLKREPKPAAWLVTLRDLRNRTVHELTLARHIDVGGGPPGLEHDWSISVNGRGVDPVHYLRTARTQVEDVTDRLMTFAETLCPHGVPVVSASTSTTVHAPTATATASATPATVSTT